MSKSHPAQLNVFNSLSIFSTRRRSIYIFRHILNKRHGNIKFKFNSKFLYCLLYMLYRALRTIKGTTELIQLDWHTHTDTYIWQLEHEMPHYRHVDPWPLEGVQETKEKQRQKNYIFQRFASVYVTHMKLTWIGGQGWQGSSLAQAMAWCRKATSHDLSLSGLNNTN